MAPVPAWDGCLGATMNGYQERSSQYNPGLDPGFWTYYSIFSLSEEVTVTLLSYTYSSVFDVSPIRTMKVRLLCNQCI